mgnify:CR=1 FL=1
MEKVQQMDKTVLIEMRCTNCNKRLGDFSIGSRYQIKCPRCGKINTGLASKNKV